jgi:hypothetical protein
LTLAPGAEQVTVGATLEHESVAVAEKVLAKVAQHSTVEAGEQVMVGFEGWITAVSLHVAWLPAWSVATHMTTRPVQSQLVAMDTVPSAF